MPLLARVIRFLPSLSSSGAQSGVDSEGSVSQHSWEAALRAKEAIVSELHAELHAVETSAANEREHHMGEVKRLHASLQAKVRHAKERQARGAALPAILPGRCRTGV